MQRAGGKWENPRGREHQVDLKIMDDPHGWAAYCLKTRRAGHLHKIKSMIKGRPFAMTQAVNAEAKVVHEARRGTPTPEVPSTTQAVQPAPSRPYAASLAWFATDTVLRRAPNREVRRKLPAAVGPYPTSHPAVSDTRERHQTGPPLRSSGSCLVLTRILMA
jgi:hypothetical protein